MLSTRLHVRMPPASVLPTHWGHPVWAQIWSLSFLSPIPYLLSPNLPPPVVSFPSLLPTSQVIDICPCYYEPKGQAPYYQYSCCYNKQVMMSPRFQPLKGLGLSRVGMGQGGAGDQLHACHV